MSWWHFGVVRLQAKKKSNDCEWCRSWAIPINWQFGIVWKFAFHLNCNITKENYAFSLFFSFSHSLSFSQFRIVSVITDQKQWAPFRICMPIRSCRSSGRSVSHVVFSTFFLRLRLFLSLNVIFGRRFSFDRSSVRLPDYCDTFAARASLFTANAILSEGSSSNDPTTKTFCGIFIHRNIYIKKNNNNNPELIKTWMKEEPEYTVHTTDRRRRMWNREICVHTEKRLQYIQYTPHNVYYVEFLKHRKPKYNWPNVWDVI